MQQSRIELLDALRGFALMGLFFIHMVEYYEVYWLNPIPHPLNDALFVLFGGKAFAMFALLFGVSFFILLNNQQSRGVDFRGRFIWRLCLLLVLGFSHSILYGGDILQVLAISGLFMVPLWRAPNGVLFTLSLFFLLMGPMWIFRAFLQWSETPYVQPLFTHYGVVLQTYAEGNFGQLIHMNAWQGNLRKWLFMLESGRFCTVIGMSMLGFLLARVQAFTDQTRASHFVIGLIGCCIVALGLWLGEDFFKGVVQQFSYSGLLQGIYETYFNLAFTLGLVCLFVVLFNSPVGGFLRPLAAPGRMTLSIYVGQSLVCVPIFYGFGLGAFALLGQVNSFLLGVFLWGLQIAAAIWWFKHFRYGPLEWVWRAATYMRRDIPFKLAQRQAAQ